MRKDVTVPKGVREDIAVYKRGARTLRFIKGREDVAVYERNAKALWFMKRHEDVVLCAS